MSFASLPFKPSIQVDQFKPHVPQAEIDDLRARLAHEAPRQRTWENSAGPSHLGVRKSFLDDAIKHWKDDFNWRDVESQIGQFPGFYGTVTYEGNTYRVHFLALFSARKDATPIAFLHGWPGSVLEFVPMLARLQTQHTPQTLPHHVLVPALVGYGFSSAPPPGGPFSALHNAGVLDALLCGLGFGKRAGGAGGYLVQGGDVGSFVARNATRFDSCLGAHVNFFPILGRSASLDTAGLDATDARAMARAAKWERWGQGYLVEHATKPATIGAVLESSPVALLAWIGEKFAESGIPNMLEFTLAEVSLYWFTRSAATCLWQYRSGSGKDLDPHVQPPKHISKPFGYSQFLNEIYPTPIPWIAQRTNLVWAERRPGIGHFAAYEQPEVMWEHVQAFARAATGKESAKL